jgi:hypothetical protein
MKNNYLDRLPRGPPLGALDRADRELEHVKLPPCIESKHVLFMTRAETNESDM